MKWVKTFRQLCRATLSLSALLIVNPAMAIDVHIHQPDDLEKATQARIHFSNAGLSDVTTEERKRLKLVLDSELAAVEENILARRNQEIIYFIDNIETKATFARIKERISKRLTNMKITEESINKYNENRVTLANEESGYQDILDAFSLNNKVKSLPICSEEEGRLKTSEGLEKQLNDAEKFELNKLQTQCTEVLNLKKALKALKQTSPYSPEMNNLKSLLESIENNAKNLAHTYKAKLKTLKQAAEADSLGNSAKHALKDINEFLCKELPVLEEEIEQYKKRCETYGIKLDVSEIKTTRFAAAAKLEILRAQQQDLNDFLTIFIEAGAYIESDTEIPEDNLNRLGVLASVFKSFHNLDPTKFASALQFEAESLRLDVLYAQKQMARLRADLELMKKQEDSWLLEWEYLSRAERIRASLLNVKGQKTCSPTGLEKTNETYHANIVVVLEKNAGEKKCKREIHRMLTELSNAWTFGYLPQQLAEYRRIALSHESALDTSEIAFLRWQNILAIPIDQLVALHSTGIKPEDMAALIQALGLGSIAVGVN